MQKPLKSDVVLTLGQLLAFVNTVVFLLGTGRSNPLLLACLR